MGGEGLPSCRQLLSAPRLLPPLLGLVLLAMLLVLILLLLLRILLPGRLLLLLPLRLLLPGRLLLGLPGASSGSGLGPPGLDQHRCTRRVKEG